MSSRAITCMPPASVGPAEVRSWTSSLMHMAKVLHDAEIPDNVGVAIEYQVPQTAKRIDFLITGLDAERQPKVVIVELKQWSEARVSEKDGIIWARRGGRAGETEGAHPSYQAWSYAALLADFNATVQDEGLALQPCAVEGHVSRKYILFDTSLEHVDAFNMLP